MVRCLFTTASPAPLAHPCSLLRLGPARVGGEVGFELAESVSLPRPLLGFGRGTQTQVSLLLLFLPLLEAQEIFL